MKEKWIHLLHGGFDPATLRTCQAEAAPAALEALRGVAGAGALLGGVLAFLLIPDAAVPGLLAVCLVPMLACLVAGHLARTILPDRPRALLPVWYGMLLLCCLSAIWADTVLQPRYSAAAFLALELALPLVLPDVPWRSSSFLAAMAVVFCALCLACKPPDLARRDIFHCIAFYLSGAIVGYRTTRSRIDDLLYRCILRRQRDTDCLTGLYTRRYCEDAISKYLASSEAPGALLLLDVDCFKQVNDYWGHDRGDALLQILAQRLQSSFRRDDILGRLGGDEFIIFLPACWDRPAVESRVESMLRSIETLTPVSTVPIPGVSVGIAMYPSDGKTFDELYRKADSALYTVKAQGRGNYAFCGEAPADRPPRPADSIHA